MINSISPQIGLGVLAQTTALQKGYAPLSFVTPPSLPQLSTTFEPDAMVQQISTQVQSSKSATEALQQVYQALLKADQTLQSGGDPSTIQGELNKLHKSLEEVQVGLDELQDDVGSAAADRRIFQQGKVSVDQSVKSLGQIFDNPSNTTPLKLAKSSTLSSIGRMEDLSRNLEQASINVMRISSAYVALPSAGGADLTSLYGLSTASQVPGFRQNVGVALDQVS